MDMKVEIKEEPVGLEESANTSCEDFLLSRMIPLKEEIKSELVEPESTQENVFEPATDIKDEIITEEQTVDELVPLLKEESRCSSPQRPYKSHLVAPHRCLVCGKGFPKQSLLNTHLLIHTGERPHRCEVCNRMFSQAGHARRHMLTHSGDKAHRCKLCTSSFSARRTLERHMLTHPRKSYRCKVCLSTFSKKCDVRLHVLTHIS